MHARARSRAPVPRAQRYTLVPPTIVEFARSHHWTTHTITDNCDAPTQYSAVP
eukprot:SAG31_NODE_6298_length_2077_cov_1.649141_3_plen_53_part_00